MRATDPTVPGGLVLRGLGLDDLAQTGQLLARRGEPCDAQDLELVVQSDGCDGVAVVADGDRIESTLTLLDEMVHIDGVAVPAGQVELVATDEAYEGRGLVRALMAWASTRSRERGHLLQIMIGIPHFYRQFGFEYVAPQPPWRPLTGAVTAPDDITVRQATSADIPAMQTLQNRAQAGADVRMGHTAACWGWLVDRAGSDQWVAERDGETVGVARTLPPDEGGALGELATRHDDAALALLASAAQRVSTPLRVQQRPGLSDSVKALLGGDGNPEDWYLARIEHLPPLLERLAPALQTRLDRAGLGGQDHDVLLSLWRSHFRFRIGPSGYQLLAEGGPEQAPLSKGGSGVPPDAVAPLLLGPHGALGLEARLPDCLLGSQRNLMAALFPPTTADLLTYYLPS